MRNLIRIMYIFKIIFIKTTFFLKKKIKLTKGEIAAAVVVPVAFVIIVLVVIIIILIVKKKKIEKTKKKYKKDPDFEKLEKINPESPQRKGDVHSSATH